ncbi:MAG: hypothetical protein AAF960_03140 [Bacteroidota bacterium]
MNNYLPTLLILCAVFLGSCKSSYYFYAPQYDLGQIERLPFEELQLKPAHDLFDFRFNIIRQSQREDNWRADEAHHPLGMYLGNGLFFDLNSNLTLDLFYLLELPKDVGFNVKLTHKQAIPPFVTEIRASPDSYCFVDPAQADEFCRTHITRTVGIEVEENNRHRYTIREENRGIELLLPDGQLVDQITPMGENAYTYRKNRQVKDFVRTPTGIQLKNYRIALTPTKDEIQVYSGRNDRFLLRLIKSKNRLYIVDENDRGVEIKVSENRLTTRGKRSEDVDMEVTFR